jgi:RecA-family ATPase
VDQNGALTQQRLLLRRRGYDPISTNGKRPYLNDWSSKLNLRAPEIESWERFWPDHQNTGILCRTTPAIDLDILDKEVIQECIDIINDRFAERGHILTRTGRWPKCLIPFRTDAPFKKIQQYFIAPNGSTDQKIEVLSDGQQFVAFGIHPDTNKPYAWFNNRDPSQIPHEELPYITEVDARALVVELSAMIVDRFGWKFKEDARKAPTGTGTEVLTNWDSLVADLKAGHGLHDTGNLLLAKIAQSGKLGKDIAVDWVASLAEQSGRDAARLKQFRAEMQRSADGAWAKFTPKPVDTPVVDEVSPGEPPPDDTPPHGERWVPNVGDWVQALLDDVLSEPALVREVLTHTDDSIWVFVEGSQTGLRLDQVRPFVKKPEPVEPLKPYVSLGSTTTSEWGTRDITRREWLLEDAIPANQAMILNGHGGEGKTLLMLQICVAIVLELHECLSMLVQRAGPVIFYSGEEDREEVDRRLADILRDTGHHPRDLTGKLHVVTRVGEDAILSTAKDDLVTPTKLYRELEEMTADLKAVFVVLDSITHVFACNQINIAHAVQNIGLMKRLSRRHRAGCMGIQHVSLSGAQSGMGTFGTMGWHNFARARAYFKSLSEKDRADDGLRLLSFMKQNYGPRGKPIELQWSAGRFVIPSVASFERRAAEMKVDDLFLMLLDRAVARDLLVSPNRSNRFAPTEFLKEPEAAAQGVTKAQFEASMKRLIDSEAIRIITEGPPSRRSQHLARPLVTSAGNPVRRYEPQPHGTVCAWCQEPGTEAKPVHRISPGGGHKSECLHLGECENAWPDWRDMQKSTVVELRPTKEQDE